jgi:hypothetical protein
MTETPTNGPTLPVNNPFHGLSKSLQAIQQDQVHNGELGLDPDTIINNEADKKEETKETKKQED